jgi:hypothetical protein
MNQKLQIRLRQISKFNNANLNMVPQVVQCGKCRKYNNVINNRQVYNCYFCSNPNYVNKN